MSASDSYLLASIILFSFHHPIAAVVCLFFAIVACVESKKEQSSDV
jgi:hypothetical protein